MDDILAAMPVSSCAGYVILAIEYGINDRVKTAFEFNGAISGITYNRINYNAKGDAYIIKYGRRLYLDNFLKI